MLNFKQLHRWQSDDLVAKELILKLHYHIESDFHVIPLRKDYI